MLFFWALMLMAMLALVWSTQRSLAGGTLPVVLRIADDRGLEDVVRRLVDRGHSVLVLDDGLHEDVMHLAQRLPVRFVSSYEQALTDSCGAMVVACIARNCSLEWIEHIG